MRAVHLELETEGKWSAGGTVNIKVAGPFSEGQLTTLYHHFADDYHPDIDRHKRADLLVNPFDDTDCVKLPRPIASRWRRWVPLFQAAKKALNVETDETGTLAVRPFLTLAIDKIVPFEASPPPPLPPPPLLTTTTTAHHYSPPPPQALNQEEVKLQVTQGRDAENRAVTAIHTALHFVGAQAAAREYRAAGEYAAGGQDTQVAQTLADGSCD